MTRAVLAAILTLLAIADTAAASTATLVYEEPIAGLEPEPVYALVVEGAPGEANALTVLQDDAGFTVRDSGATLQPGEGCEADEAGGARCPMTRPATTLTVFVGASDGADAVTATSLPPATFVQVNGGTGDDSLATGGGEDLLLGGPGDDTFAAGDGFDRLEGGRGDDVFDGGTGPDRVLYEARSNPVQVDLAAGTGGAAGERDAFTAVEDITGGRAADRLSGDGSGNSIVGGRGDARDVVVGRGGDDTLTGHRVSGGSGDDSLDGRVVSCGEGSDLLRRGSNFALRGPFRRSCETVLAIFLTLEPDPVQRSRGSATFAIACRAPKCKGTLELRDRQGRLGITKFSQNQGEDLDELHRIRVPLERPPLRQIATLHISGDRAYQRDWFRTRLGRPSRYQ